MVELMVRILSLYVGREKIGYKITLVAMAGWRRGCTRGVYCALPLQKQFRERGHTRDLPTRRRAAESRGLDLGRQTGACAPHCPPSLLRQLCHYVCCCCVAKQSRAPLDAGYRFLACFICNIASDHIGRDHIGTQYTLGLI